MTQRVPPGAEKMADALQNKCRDAAFAVVEMMSASDPEMGPFVARHQDVFDAGVEAGIAGSFLAFKDLGVFDGRWVEELKSQLGES